MPYQDHFIYTNKIRLHFIEYKTDENLPKLLLLHGLTANAHTFDGLISRGLAERFHLFIPDLRGRGHSDKPEFNYSVRHHAKDIIGMLDQLGIEQIAVAGHSFGGLLSVYLAVHYPERISKIVIIDAAAEMNSKVALMLQPVLKRLERTFDSFEAYLDYMKSSPTINFWEDEMTTYYRADVETLSNGKVRTYPSLSKMIKVSIGVYSQPWRRFFKDVQQPALLINATDIYNLNEPLLPEYKAKESVQYLQQGSYLQVDGNHQTMLYGKGAFQIMEAVTNFVREEELVFA
jgi:pimeloyl-ACP methyl ester carboxylesterase